MPEGEFFSTCFVYDIALLNSDMSPLHTALNTELSLPPMVATSIRNGVSGGVAGGFVLAAVSYISTGSIDWSSVVLFAGAFTVVFLLLGLWFSNYPQDQPRY